MAGAFRQDIGTVAQWDVPQCLDGAPKSHPGSGTGSGKAGNEEMPM